MKRKRFAVEQIISKLRQAEIMFSEGKSLDEVVKKLEITAQTYYRWRKEYGTLQMEQAKRLKRTGERKHPLKEGRCRPGS